VPPAQPLGCQCLHLDAADFRVDVRLGSAPRVVAALAVRIQKFEVAFNSVTHRQRPALASGMLRAGNHALARLGLRLPVAQDRGAVSVAVVVGGGDGLGLVGLLAGVMAHDPTPSLATQPAVAKVAPWLKLAPVRLASRLEPLTRGAGFKLSVADGTCHLALHLGRLAPTANLVSNTMANIRGKTVTDKQTQTCT
jgi:hypothetical protein